MAIITGASRGIGKAIAQEFVSQGAKVAFTYRSSEEKARALEAELTSNGGTVRGFKSDAAEMDQAEALVSEVVEAFGTARLLAVLEVLQHKADSSLTGARASAEGDDGVEVEEQLSKGQHALPRGGVDDLRERGESSARPLAARIKGRRLGSGARTSPASSRTRPRTRRAAAARPIHADHLMKMEW